MESSVNSSSVTTTPVFANNNSVQMITKTLKNEQEERPQTHAQKVKINVDVNKNYNVGLPPDTQFIHPRCNSEKQMNEADKEQIL